MGNFKSSQMILMGSQRASHDPAYLPLSLGHLLLSARGPEGTGPEAGGRAKRGFPGAQLLTRIPGVTGTPVLQTPAHPEPLPTECPKPE